MSYRLRKPLPRTIEQVLLHPCRVLGGAGHDQDFLCRELAQRVLDRQDGVRVADPRLRHELHPSLSCLLGGWLALFVRMGDRLVYRPRRLLEA